jgi:stage II sporulation protein D
VLNKGKLNLVNVLPMEDYLRGVLPGEVSPEWPLASLKAQAIAARTYTIASLKRHGQDYDLCTGTHCQVYSGVTLEKASTDRAVAETTGEIVTYHGKPITAYYHSAAGNTTVDAQYAWGKSVPYLKPVVDWDHNSPRYEWTKVYSWEEIQGMAAKAYPKLGSLTHLVPTEFAPDGRVLKMKLEGVLGEMMISGEQFRSMTGIPSCMMKIGVVYGPDPFITLWWVHNQAVPEAIMATDEIPGLTAEVLSPPWDQPDPWAWLQDKEPVKVVIRGNGWGHGVGLSQWGAKGMAEFGYTEDQILRHYYPGTVLARVNDIK